MNAQHPLKVPSKMSQPKLLNASFNQDQSCFAVCNENGFQVYSTEPMELRMRRKFQSKSGNNGIGIVSMLYRTNYVALVGGGKRPRFPVNKLCIWDDLKMKPSIFLEFMNPILNVLLSRVRIVVITKNQVAVYAFRSQPNLISMFETYTNDSGACDLSINESGSILAFPGRSEGQIQLADISPENQNKNLVSIIKAHKAGIQSLCISNSGKLVASASVTGTIIRIHDTSNCALLYEFRRGIDKALVTSMRFSPDDARLAVLSDKNTLHVYNLRDVNTGVAEKQGPTFSANKFVTDGRKRMDGESNKMHFLKGIPLLPKYFRSTWSFASKNVGNRADEYKDTGVIGWSDSDTIILLWKFKGTWEKYTIVDDFSKVDPSSSDLEGKQKCTILKVAWRNIAKV